MTNILTLDLATRTGWCLGEPGMKPVFGAIEMPETGERLGRYAAHFEDWLVPFLVDHGVTQAVYESPILPKKTTIATVRKLNGLAMEAERICYRAGVKVNKANRMTVTKHFCGKGGAKKPEVIARCNMLGYGLSEYQDDEADAIAIWDWACATIDPHAHSKHFGGW